MRILLISQEMPPETGWGGIGTYVDVLSEALAGRGADVHVLSIVADQPSSTVRRGQVTVHRRHCRRRRSANGSRPKPRAGSGWRLSTHGPCPGSASTRTSSSVRSGWRRVWGSGCGGSGRLVVRLHSSASQLFPLQRTGPRLAWSPTAVFRAGSSTRRRAARTPWSAPDQISTTSRGPMRLNPDVLHAIPYPVRLGVPEPMPVTDTPRVTFVGRLEPRKGPDLLLAAAPAVLRAVPEARFVFVGRDVSAPGERPSSPWLKTEAGRLGIGPAIELTGGLTAEGVTDELRRASVCAFPSKWESFGNVVAEAAAVGRPVVASPIPPFRELVEDGVTGTARPRRRSRSVGDRDRRAAPRPRAGGPHGRTPEPRGSPASAPPTGSPDWPSRPMSTRSRAGAPAVAHPGQPRERRDRRPRGVGLRGGP